MSVGHHGLRAEAARLAAAAAGLKRRSSAKAPFALAFLTDRRRIADPEPVFKAMPRGAAVVYRDYDAPGRAATAARYRRICRARGVLFLLAGDVELARAVGADGVHFPARLLARAAPAAGLLATASCHDAGELARAAALGADCAFLGPVFPTESHEGAVALGPERFRALAAAAGLPVLALGGVDAENSALLAGRNVAGFGAIGAFARPRAP